MAMKYRMEVECLPVGDLRAGRGGVPVLGPDGGGALQAEPGQAVPLHYPELQVGGGRVQRGVRLLLSTRLSILKQSTRVFITL